MRGLYSMQLKHLDLFSGIGGFALAAEMAGGITTQQFVEVDSYCQKVLAKNFPSVPTHGDITTFSATSSQYDIITGGFPCQDISAANHKGQGLDGKRSGLFFELMRIVRECRPRYIVLENVAALLSKRNGRDMGTVLWELSECGYDAEWQVVSAASVGAPHLRKRVFIVAYCDRGRLEARQRKSSFQGKVGTAARSSNAANSYSPRGWANTATASQRTQKKNTQQLSGNCSRGFQGWQAKPPVLRVDDGVPEKLDRDPERGARMDKYLVIKKAIEQKRLDCDPATGDVFSLVQRGRKGERVKLKGTEIKGYKLYRIYFEGHKYMIRGHRIIWWFCNGEIPEGLQIDHKNRVRNDNRIDNLRVVTQEENNQNRRSLAGANNPSCKLDPIHHLALLELVENGATYKEAGESFGISKSQVGNIVKKYKNKDRVDRIRGLGNAVVPQAAVIPLRRVLELEEVSHATAA